MRATWASVLVLLAAASFYVGRRSAAAAPDAALELQALDFQAVTDHEGLERRPALSPDGRYVVYEANLGASWEIWSQRVGGSRAQNLTADLEGDQRHPALSPDGEQIAFRSEHDGGGLFVMGATGESPRRVTDFGFNPCWSPDGERIAFSSQTTNNPRSRGATSPLFLADVASGEVREIAVEDAVDPAWSPDGRWVAYWGSSLGGQRDIHLVSPEGGAPVALTDDAPTDWGPTWSADGEELFFASDRSGVMSLWRLAIDAATGRPRGGPRLLVGGVGASCAQPNIARDAPRLAFTASVNDRYLARVAFDPERREVVGAPERIPGTRGAATASVSPDGEWIAFHRGGAQEDLYLMRRDGSDRRRVTDDPFKDRIPAWSADGERLFFFSDRAGRYEIWSCALDGSGLVQHSLGGATGPKVAPGGDRLAIGFPDGRVGFLDLDQPLGSEQEAKAALTPEDGTNLATLGWSPDGSWVTVGVNRDGDSGLALLSADGQTFDPILASAEHGSWLADGSGIVFTDEQGALGLWDAETREWRQLLTLPDRTLLAVSPSPDGRWLYLEVWAGTADVWVASLVEEPEH